MNSIKLFMKSLILLLKYIQLLGRSLGISIPSLGVYELKNNGFRVEVENALPIIYEEIKLDLVQD